ncbi:type VII secretion-associated serine protease mycosin [Streptomyces sp. NPDC058067]|uniref:type VII secretion-associated serine protease mycosin n=1 Tax=Streptomyces sp. NPDC058067 TaxID=3346324 RepID=UPI0036E5145C
MFTNGTRHRRRGAASAAAFGALLLVGGVAGPAHAESTRDQQWFLTAMKAESMWRTSKGEGVTVAVIDSGVDPNNPDLKGRVLAGLDLAPKEEGDEHTDYEGHGTGMAALVAATGAYGGGHGSFGLAPGAKILPIRLPDGAKFGNQYQSADAYNTLTPKAIRYAVDHGAKVINISQGFIKGSAALSSAVDYALKHDSLIFAATGNSGDAGNTLEYPAATPGVVGVGAIGKNLHRTTESTYGRQVDISAPGDEMVHACGTKASQSELCKTHGTSDATALASASAALIWSKHPNWTNNQVLRVMLNTIGGPTDGAKRNNAIGYGIVRPRIALTNPGNPGPADKFPMADYPVEAKSPSDEPSKATGAEVPDDAGSAAPAAEAKGDGSNAPLWIGIGVGALVVAGAATAIAITRSRRSVAAAQASPPPYPQAQSHGAPQYTNPQAPNSQSYAPPSGDGRENPYRGT